MTDCLPLKKSGRENVFQVLKKWDPKTSVRNSEEKQNAIVEKAAQRREVLFNYVQDFLIDGKELRKIYAFQINSTYKRVADPDNHLSVIELYSYVHFPVSVFLVLFHDVEAMTPIYPSNTVLSQIENQPEEKLTLVMPQGPYQILDAVCLECDGRKPDEKFSEDLKRNEVDPYSAEIIPVSKPFGIVIFDTSTRETLFRGTIYNPTRKIDGMKKALKSCIPSVNEVPGCFGVMRKASSKKELNKSGGKNQVLGTKGQQADAAVPEKTPQISNKLQEPLGSECKFQSGNESAVKEDVLVSSISGGQELEEKNQLSQKGELPLEAEKAPVKLEELVTQSLDSVTELRSGYARQTKTTDAQQKVVDDSAVFFDEMFRSKSSKSPKKTVEKICVTEDVQRRLEANLISKLNASGGVIKRCEPQPAKRKVLPPKSSEADDNDTAATVEDQVEMKTIGKVRGERAVHDAITPPVFGEQQEEYELFKEAKKLWHERDGTYDEGNVVVPTLSSGGSRKIWSRPINGAAPLYFGLPKRAPTVRRHKPAAH